MSNIEEQDIVFTEVASDDEKGEIKITKMDIKEAKKKIYYNFKMCEQIFLSESKLRSTHEGITGNSREEFWVKIFDRIIPNKFSIESNVIIVDSYGSVSHEVDIAIIDKEYTPFVFSYGHIKFVPIEAVAVVVECKSSGWDDKFIREWSKSIEKLKTNPYGMARMVNGLVIGDTNNSQKRTSPIKILASLRKNPQDNTIEKLDDLYDFFIYREEKDKCENVRLYVPKEDCTLGWWSDRLNCFKEKENNELEVDKNLELQKNKEQSIFRYEVDEDKKKILEKESNVSFLFKKVEDKNKKSDIAVKNEYSVSTNSTLKSLRIEDNVFMTLNFQLNQLLMLINNPMLYPHFEYAAMFNEKVLESKTQGADSCTQNSQ